MATDFLSKINAAFKLGFMAVQGHRAAKNIFSLQCRNRSLYSNHPDGLCGNEDMGQMSAWYVFSACGFYPVNPADGRYVFGTPQFDELSILLPNKGYNTHQQLLEGGTLEFKMRKKQGMVFSME